MFAGVGVAVPVDDRGRAVRADVHSLERVVAARALRHGPVGGESGSTDIRALLLAFLSSVGHFGCLGDLQKMFRAFATKKRVAKGVCP